MKNEGFRDLLGYGRTTPDPRWPGSARLAVQFAIHYLTGAETDEADDRVVGGSPAGTQRDLNAESDFEYGSRAGMWRLLRLFADRNLAATIFASGKALEQTPALAEAMVMRHHEVAAYGWRWTDHRRLT